jgi:PleD family two-component response regulator
MSDQSAPRRLILAIDDDEMAHLMLKHVLEREGFLFSKPLISDEFTRFMLEFGANPLLIQNR